MKKVVLSIAVVSAILAGTNAKAQLVDEQNVTVTMDLQPILQLNMNGSNNIEFVFDQISEYVGGITQYGATVLSVSSTVSWDLYAAGFSSASANGNAATDLIWDNQVTYGDGADVNASTSLPLTLLELRQDKANPDPGAAAAPDYSTPFGASGAVTLGNNNVYATSAPYTRPDATAKYIAGGFAGTEAVPGGTYLVTSDPFALGAASGAASVYYYTIDYRIVPGLPAIFPNATDATPVDGGNNGTAGDLVTLDLTGGGADYAKPGVYTMNVKYVLFEN